VGSFSISYFPLNLQRLDQMKNEKWKIMENDEWKMIY